MASEYMQVKIKKECLDTLQKTGELRILIVFSRILNTLKSNFRSYLCVDSDDNLRKFKDRLDIIFIHGAMIYEAIKTICSFGSDLKKLNLSPQGHKYFSKQMSDKNSFWNTVLDRIRNKFFFHFDQNELLSALKSLDLKEDITFITSKSEKDIDMIYSLTDDLLLTYITELYDSDSIELDNLQEVQNKIVSMSDKICKFCQSVIQTILNDKAYRTQ